MYFLVSTQEKEKIIYEWDGLTRYLDAVMSRFFRVNNYEVGVFSHNITYYRVIVTHVHCCSTNSIINWIFILNKGRKSGKEVKSNGCFGIFLGVVKLLLTCPVFLFKSYLRSNKIIFN